MLVMCVKAFESICGYSGESMPAPQIGDTDEVASTREHNGAIYYKLERFSDKCNYRSDHFAILPDQSADEMQEQEREGIVNIETV